jgi:thiol:disulfide interchange protein DsbC
MRFANLKSVSLTLLAAACMGGVWTSAAANTEGDPAAKLLQTLRETYRGTQFSSVRPTPINGVWEVVMGTKVSYTDSNGRYFMFGNLVDLQTQENLTEGRTAELTRVDPATLPLSQAVKTVKGDGSRSLYVFVDPECGYCKQLESTLKSVENVTVYTFLFPVLGPKSVQNAESIWCAKDRSAALSNHMLGTMPVPTAKCENPLSANMKLAESLGISGTPTLVSGNGTKVPGALPLDKLKELIATGGKPISVAAGKK